MKYESYLKTFLRYTFLSILGMLGVSCYILADTFFVANGLGTHGLAALNIALPAYNFIHGTGLMLGMGSSTKFSICKSKKENAQVNIIFTNTIYLSLIFGVAFCAGGLFFSGPLAAFLGADSQIFVMTSTYLKWLLFFSPAFIINDVLLCFVRNDGGPTLSALAMLIGSLSNIVFDYIFIFPLKMGILGAVLATGVSPVISILILSPHWLRRKNSFHLTASALHWYVFIQAFSLGFPSMLAQVSSGISMMLFNFLILGLEGNTGVAAYGVIANLSLVVVAVYTGISQGIQPLISEAYGHGNQKTISTGFRYAMTTMLVISCMIYFILFLGAGPITRMFNSENNLRLQELSVYGLKLYFSSNIFVGFNTILAVFLTSMERPIPAHILSLLRGLILIIPVAFLLSHFLEMTGIWLSYPLTEGVVAILGLIICRHIVTDTKRS